MEKSQMRDYYHRYITAIQSKNVEGLLECYSAMLALIKEFRTSSDENNDIGIALEYFTIRETLKVIRNKDLRLPNIGDRVILQQIYACINAVKEVARKNAESFIHPGFGAMRRAFTDLYELSRKIKDNPSAHLYLWKYYTQSGPGKDFMDYLDISFKDEMDRLNEEEVKDDVQEVSVLD